MTSLEWGTGAGHSGAGRAVLWRPVRDRMPGLGLPELSRLVCGPDETARTCFPEVVADDQELLSRPQLRFGAGASTVRIPGRHPLVLAIGSLASRGGEFIALGEALASRGIVVAEVVSTGDGSPGGFDGAAVRLTLDRIDQALLRLADEPDVDVTRLAVLTWSFGGVPGAVVACARAQALVSLDSALRYGYGANLLRGQRFNAVACRASLLALEAGIGNTVATDEAFVAAWPVERLERRVGDGLSHGDFSDRHGALPAGLQPPAEAADFRRRYRAMTDAVVAFLAARLSAPAAR